MRRKMIVVATALAALVAAPGALAGPANSTELLSLPTGLAVTPATANDSTPWSTSLDSVTTGNDPGEQLASTDRRYVVFTSTADGMSGDDTDNVQNVYVRDIATSTTILVSRADGATRAPANGNSQHPAISGNGQFVAFASRATNLFSSDTGVEPGLRARPRQRHDLPRQPRDRPRRRPRRQRLRRTVDLRRWQRDRVLERRHESRRRVGAPAGLRPHEHHDQACQHVRHDDDAGQRGLVRAVGVEATATSSRSRPMPHWSRAPTTTRRPTSTGARWQATRSSW